MTGKTKSRPSARACKKGRARCANICCSTFTTYSDPEVLCDGANLDNSVHKIFSPEKFSEDFDWDVIEVPVRLASLLLQSDNLVPFINIMTNGELRFANGPRKGEIAMTPADTWFEAVDDEGDYMNQWMSARWPKLGQDEVNDETRKEARSVLAALVDMIDITMADDPACGGKAVPLEGPLE